MKYAGMPLGMWMLFHRSFTRQLTAVLGQSAESAKATEKAALARLSRWIKRIPALFAAIYGPQQCKRLHYFTRHQVELIFEYLDEP